MPVSGIEIFTQHLIVLPWLDDQGLPDYGLDALERASLPYLTLHTNLYAQPAGCCLVNIKNEFSSQYTESYDICLDVGVLCSPFTRITQ